MPERRVQLQRAFSTSTCTANPLIWIGSAQLFGYEPSAIKEWTNLWIECDFGEARLFFTSFNGKLWRSHTTLDSFCHGCGGPDVVLEADLFEVARVYALKDCGGCRASTVEAHVPSECRH